MHAPIVLDQLPFVPASLTSLLVFGAVLVWVFVWLTGLFAAGAARPWPARAKAAAALCAWLALTAAWVTWGPRTHAVAFLMPFLLGSNALAVALALSPLGARMSREVPVAMLLGFQALRVPLELVLASWATQGTIPVAMSFRGQNVDILAGLVCGAAALWVLRASRAGSARAGSARAGHAVAFAANLVGTGLLLNVGRVAVQSSPLPWTAPWPEPPLLLALHLPYAWIVPFAVAPALMVHVVTFRALRQARR